MVKNRLASSITIIVVVVSMILATIVLSGCRDVTAVFAWYEGSTQFDNLPIIMNAGETLVVTRNHFEHLDVDFESFEIWVNVENGIVGNPIENSAVVAVDGNTIIAGNSGHVLISATLTMPREGSTQRHWGVWLAWIYVINENTMTHITTPEELANINDNLTGHFILMDDIDLGDYEWTPIGQSTIIAECDNCAGRVQGLRCECGAFRGFFVNPHGYVISNLTITKYENTDVGLFGLVYGSAFIDGVILENISIDTSGYYGNDFDSPRTGGLVGITFGMPAIMNVSVQGYVTGGGTNTGGIVGFNDGIIVNSRFEGTLNATGKWNSSDFGIGGIVGRNFFVNRNGLTANIVNCTVRAYIDGEEWANAGGIAGVVSNNSAIIDSKFEGDLTMITGRRAGTKIGLVVWSGGILGPINFD